MMPSIGNIGHKHPFVKTIDLALRDRCDIEPGSRLILAVSGGADSVAMMRAMALIAPRKHWQLHLFVGHVQHHLRDNAAGDATGDAEKDARFVESLAAALNLPYLRRDLDLNTAKGNLEDAARKARYAALLNMADEAEACAVVTAHHGDDQLETLLMRLLRGASVSGLRGIAWRRDVDQRQATCVVRPMLGVDRSDIIQFLDELDQNWREDHTNADLSKVRAKLRADVLPHLHDLNPHFAERLVSTMDHFNDVTELIDESTDSAERFVDESDSGRSVFPRDQARQMPSVVLTELLRRLCIRAGVGADALGNRTLRPVIRMIRDHEGGRRIVELQQEVVVEITRDNVSIQQSKAF